MEVRNLMLDQARDLFSHGIREPFLAKEGFSKLRDRKWTSGFKVVALVP